MQLVLHAGAHYTEEERLLKSLLANTERLAKAGTVVPGPSTYRGLFRDTLNAMYKSSVADGAREVLLDAILDDADANRVILSDPNFFRTPATAVVEGMLYPAAPVRMMRIVQLFPDDQIELFLGIRNPATLLPILHGVSADNSDPHFWGNKDQADVCWSETLELLHDSAPEIAVTVWCNEDAPLIWGTIMREIAGLPKNTKLNNEFDLLETIMSVEGMKRFQSYMAAHPEISGSQEQKVIAAFLGKFAMEDAIEEEVDMPGWTEDLVEEMTENYDQDVLRIQQIPNVRMIMP
ncbi:MAG: hypothetical protein GQ539_16925 [Sulfitobacter sp.]|nr:hypothetical protein [Sulfitobacter sp.]